MFGVCSPRPRRRCRCFTCATPQPTVRQPVRQSATAAVPEHLERTSRRSPRLPLIPESLIIHHADDLDAKLEMQARCLRKDAEPFTARDPVLGRQLFKGRSV